MMADYPDTLTLADLPALDDSEWESIEIDHPMTNDLVDHLLDKLRPNTTGTLTKPLLEQLIAGGMSHSDNKPTHKLSYRQIQDMLR